MHKKLLLLLLSFNLVASEDTISKFAHDYFKNIHGHISDESFDKAQNLLDIAVNRYWQNENSYERALLNQLYGQFYAIQNNYDEAIPWFEKALYGGGMAKVGAQEVRFQLSQTYFMVGRYEEVIKILNEFIVVGERYKYPISARINLLLSYSHGRLDEYSDAYYHIKQANIKSDKPQIEWIEYAFNLAMKQDLYEDAEVLGARLIFLNPEKKKYWNQVSALYFAKDIELNSLSALELAYENNTLTKGDEYLLLAKYYLYQQSPIKSIMVLNDGINKELIEENEKNLKLLSSSYFFSRDVKNGIKILQKTEKISDDPDISYRLGMYAFEIEDYELAISSFKKAINRGWNEVPGRLELIMGISYFELDDSDLAKQNFQIASNFDDTKDTANGWLSYIEQFN